MDQQFFIASYYIMLDYAVNSYATWSLCINIVVITVYLNPIWRTWWQNQTARAWISNYIPQYTVGCYCLSVPKIHSFDKVIIYALLPHVSYLCISIWLIGCGMGSVCIWMTSYMVDTEIYVDYSYQCIEFHKFYNIGHDWILILFV